MAERDIRSLQRERRRLGRTIRSLKRENISKRDEAVRGKKRGGFGFVLLLMLIAVLILWYWFFYLKK
ncbi:hypothetical protein HYU07_04690 [Candidatus Woesearchaeota archaeon]|nr:hypothetical protein [Candidatus Woesearchaeota archaeon]